jgi:transcriptional regulator with XRE-family HTH domain
MNKHEDLRIGQIIKILRAAMGLRQKDLAERVGIQPHYLSLVEAGKREPSLAVLRKIASELDVPVSLLFWEAEQRPESIASEHQEHWKSLRSLLVEMERMRLREKNGERASNEVA